MTLALIYGKLCYSQVRPCFVISSNLICKIIAAMRDRALSDQLDIEPAVSTKRTTKRALASSYMAEQTGKGPQLSPLASSN